MSTKRYTLQFMAEVAAEVCGDPAVDFAGDLPERAAALIPQVDPCLLGPVVRLLSIFAEMSQPQAEPLDQDRAMGLCTVLGALNSGARCLKGPEPVEVEEVEPCEC